MQKENGLTNLLKKLDHVWYVVDTEDEDRKRCVERRNVAGLIEHLLVDNCPITELWDAVCDDCGSCELEDVFYGETVDDAYSKALEASNYSRAISANCFINADNGQLNEHDSIRFAKEIAIALGVDISETEINPSFWDQSFEDGLTPIQSANSAGT
ncbi:hypothetical protein A3715_15565 [Oleiphilus sp. HI0009]|nr:hypothetical protein A3715_15565 [Oleiphilus sp. HI0009]